VRARAWQSLAPLVVGTERTDGRFRIVFEPAASGDVEALVSAERSCCGWATWSMRSTSRSVEVDVTGPPDELAALADSFRL
jgi:hypothetical protein